MLQQLICCEAPEMFNVLEKKNLPSAGGVSKLQLNFHFWVKCSFKHVSLLLSEGGCIIIAIFIIY